MQLGSVLSVTPSFSSYFSDMFAKTADRVVEECRAADKTELSCQEDPFSFVDGRNQLICEFGENSRSETKDDDAKADENDDRDDESDSEDDEFEFSFVTGEADSSTISADEIFFDGRIRPTFPVFGKELFSGDAKLPPPAAPPGRRLPLRKLFTEERQSSLSSSSSSSLSSEADELEGVKPGTYCVWTPKRPGSEAATAVAQQRKKSNSTGSTTTSSSSRRWRFRELLGRSNSDEKETFVFLMPKKRKETLKVATSQAGGHGRDR